MPTGLGINPCLEPQWQGSKYCPTGPNIKALNVDLVKKRQLFLADPNEYLDAWVGTKLPLHATAFFKDRIVPPGSYVEFYSNGRLLSRGELDIPALNGTYSPGFSGIWLETNGIPAGTYPIVAILKNPLGEELAVSNEVQITIPEQPGANTIAWLNPPNSVLSEAGPHIPLRAGTFILPDFKEGAYVEFYRDGQLLGRGIPTIDGDYSFDMTTDGLMPGVYPMKAVLKSADNQVLSETPLNDLIIQDRRKASVGLINLDGKNVLQIGEILKLDAVVDLRLPVIYSGTELELLANGKPIGKAYVTKDGNYLLDWNTAAQPPGDYDLEVIVRDNQGREMARSEKVKITIEGSLPQPGGGLNPNALSLSAPSDTLFPGVKVPLKANLNLPPDQIPEGAYVEFIQNGKVIGRGIRQPDGSYEMAWDTQGIPAGDYPIKAVLKTKGGQILIESPLQTVRLDASSRNRIDLTSGNVTTLPGSMVNLEAMANANPEELKNGAYVEFYQGGQRLGRGVLMPGGTYEYDWDTGSKPTGEYPVQAILKSGIGATLAESTIATVTLTDTTQNSIELLTIEVRVKPGAEALLQARPTINAVELKKGAYVEFWQNNALLGRGVRQSDGSYTFGWDTKGLKLGTYPVKALLISSTKKTLAQSLNGKVILTDSSSNLITLMAPSNNTSASVGSQLALKATVDITPEQKKAGYYVEFYYGSVTKPIAKGTPQEDGSYAAIWDTGELNPIAYLVRAVLKQPSGKELASSDSAKVQLSRASSGGGGGGGGSSSGDRNANGLQLKAPFGVTAIPGETIAFEALALFSTANQLKSHQVEFFVDSNPTKVGNGSKDGGTNNYKFNWDSTSKSLGSHSVTARSVVDGSEVVLVSEVGDLNLIANAVVMNQPSPAFEEVIGEGVVLQATPTLSDQQKGNVDIEFYLGDPASGGVKLGDGGELPDGSFTFTWDTIGQSAGAKDIYARLKDNRTDTLLADSVARQMILLSNQVTMVTPVNNSIESIGTQIPVQAHVVTTEGLINGGAKVRFYNGATFMGEVTGANNFQLVSGNQYLVTLNDPVAVPTPINNYDTTSLTGSQSFVAHLTRSNGEILQVATGHQVDFISSDIQLILPNNDQVNLIGDSVVLQASVDILPADVSRPKRVDFYVDNGVKVGEVFSGDAINGDQARRSFTLDWTADGTPRTVPVYAQYFVDEGSGYVKRGDDSPSRNLVLINNTITWIKTPNSLDILPGDSLGVGTIDNNDPNSLDPDDFIIEVQLKPSQVPQITSGALKLGIDVDGDNIPDSKVKMLDVSGNETTSPIAVPGNTVDHGGGSTTLTPGFYRYRLRWNATLLIPENDGDNTNNVGDNKVLKAELRNGGGNMAVSGNTGSVNIKAGNIVSLDTIDTVNTKDGVTVGGKAPIGTSGTPVNVLVGDSSVTLSATPILSSAQRGVAIIDFYKTVNSGSRVLIDSQTTGAATTYTTPAFTISESNNDDIEYSVEVRNLFDNFGTPLSPIGESDFAKAIDFAVDLTTPTAGTVLNDGVNSNQSLVAHPTIPHKYDNVYGSGLARVNFTLEGDLNPGSPTQLKQDTTITNASNGASQSWTVNFSGIEDSDVGSNAMNLRANLEVDTGSGFVQEATDLHVVSSRNHNVDLVDVIAFHPSTPGTTVTIGDNDDTLFDNDSVPGDQTETIRVTGNVTADAPPAVASVRLMLIVASGSETEIESKAYTGPGNYSFDYIPTTGSTATNGINHRFRIVIKDGSGTELDTTANRDVDVIKNAADITGVNEGGIYQSGRDAQTGSGNEDQLQDKVTFKTTLKLSKLQLAKDLDVTFELEGIEVETVADPTTGTDYETVEQTLNGLTPFDPANDKTAQAIIKEGGTPLFEGSTKNIDLIDPEITMYAIDKATKQIQRIISRTGVTDTVGDIVLSDTDSPFRDAFGIAKDPANGQVYFVTRFDISNTISNKLVKWDPKAGDKTLSGTTAYSEIAQLSTGTSSTARLSFNQNGGDLYLSLSTFAGLEFYRVNKSTGALSSAFTINGVDASSFTNIEGDIAFDTDGTLYLAHGTELYRSTVPITNASSAINLELMPGYTQTDNIFGISLDEVVANSTSTRLLLVRKTGTTSELIEVNKSTGAVTSIDSDLGTQYTDITSSHNIP